MTIGITMRMAAIAVGVLIVPLAALDAARSQTFDDVQVVVRGYELRANGGEHSEVSFSTGPVVVGTSESGVFSVRGCGLFGVSSGSSSFMEEAATGWRVEVTPLRVVNHAVTFRLRWLRALDNTKGFTPAGGDVELTLKRGESRPIDSVPVPTGAKTLDGGPCKVSATSLRVSVDYYPDEQFDQRLVAADLWLIERLPRGGDRTQSLALRGLPNRPMPFYFDSIVEGTISLDIHGQVVARPEKTAMAVTLQTRSRWGDNPLPTGPYRTAGNSEQRWVESMIQVKPGETVEVGLPKLGAGAGPFANRVFSIRIRARQLR
jgi:hypothetical protein